MKKLLYALVIGAIAGLLWGWLKSERTDAEWRDIDHADPPVEQAPLAWGQSFDNPEIEAYLHAVSITTGVAIEQVRKEYAAVLEEEAAGLL